MDGLARPGQARQARLGRSRQEEERHGRQKRFTVRRNKSPILRTLMRDG